MDASEPIDAGIQEIKVAGYKSICDEQKIAICPLTILAGANSSGKSSMMQTLLLLKQTLEASYDPGPLLLDGPNVRFTSTEQMFCKIAKGEDADRFHVEIHGANEDWRSIYYRRSEEAGIEIEKMERVINNKVVELRQTLSSEEIEKILSPSAEEALNHLRETAHTRWSIKRDRCFLNLAIESYGVGERRLAFGAYGEGIQFALREIIHLPALRGNPARTYPIAAVNSTFPGTFEKYAASVIAHWQKEGNNVALAALDQDLKDLGLTWKVVAKRVDDSQIELHVGRLPQPDKNGVADMVNIADVGVGVSQTLPILVALHTAQKGQMVYIEQPEVHLHPNAQWKMAFILAQAAQRGVHVVVETHSSLVLRGIQAAVATDKLAPEKVSLNWFSRHPGTGATQISTGSLDHAGAYGDWPEDFDDVSLRADSDYMDAAELRLAKG